LAGKLLQKEAHTRQAFTPISTMNASKNARNIAFSIYRELTIAYLGIVALLPLTVTS
jgi:hypothetical protein